MENKVIKLKIEDFTIRDEKTNEIEFQAKESNFIISEDRMLWYHILKDQFVFTNGICLHYILRTRKDFIEDFIEFTSIEFYNQQKVFIETVNSIH